MTQQMNKGLANLQNKREEPNNKFQQPGRPTIKQTKHKVQLHRDD